MLRRIVPVLLALVAALTVLPSTPAHAASSGTEIRLETVARSSQPSLKFNARYEERTDRNRKRFDVEIQNVRPGTKHLVFWNGKPMGAITANQYGRGKLSLRINWDGTNVASLPRMKPGDVITVNKLSGRLYRD